MKIFISYRQNDSPGDCRELCERLQQSFGKEHVFFDVHSLRLGENWWAVASERLRSSDVLLVPIGQNWMTIADRRGRRRLDDPRDPLRREIALALREHVRTIPVLVEGAAMPEADQLPEELKELADLTGWELRHATFTSDVDALIERLGGTAAQDAAVLTLEGAYRRRYNDASFAIGQTDYIRFTAEGRFQERGFLRVALGSQILPDGGVVFFDAEAGGEGTFALRPGTLDLRYTSNSYAREHQIGGGTISLSFSATDRVPGTNVVAAALLNTYTFVRLEAEPERAHPPPPQAINLTGAWQAPNGAMHFIQQRGNVVTIQCRNMFGVVVLQSQGTLSGSIVNAAYDVMYQPPVVVHGQARYEVAPDATTITGQMMDPRVGVQSVYLRRVG